jgi:hypothetical protein
MGYRDDLINRLQQDGLWNQLTSEQQTRFHGLTDEQARQMMIMDDQWDMGDEEAVELFGLLSLTRMIMSFKGALVQHEGENVGKLSRAGELLAEFFIELTERGLSSDDVDEGLRSLSPLSIAALKTVYKRSE